ncbi:unnamed protein product, partial [Ectocarpus sp. 8 AP-2014]
SPRSPPPDVPTGTRLPRHLSGIDQWRRPPSTATWRPCGESLPYCRRPEPHGGSRGTSGRQPTHPGPRRVVGPELRARPTPRCACTSHTPFLLPASTSHA